MRALIREHFAAPESESEGDLDPPISTIPDPSQLSRNVKSYFAFFMPSEKVKLLKQKQDLPTKDQIYQMMVTKLRMTNLSDIKPYVYYGCVLKVRINGVVINLF